MMIVLPDYVVTLCGLHEGCWWVCGSNVWATRTFLLYLSSHASWDAKSTGVLYLEGGVKKA